jgi:hypothetical protein
MIDVFTVVLIEFACWFICVVLYHECGCNVRFYKQLTLVANCSDGTF